MLAGLVTLAKAEASRTAQTAALGLGASLCLAVGLGFLTLAGWLFLTATMAPMHAALIMGSAYFGLALILFATISLKRRAVRRARAQAALAAQAGPPAAQSLSQMILAFTTGMQAGRKARY